MLTDQIRKLIESSPVAIASVMPDGRPNVIVIADVKVVSENMLLIGDNYMNQTVQDILHQNSVALLVWSDLIGYKLIGTAEYFTRGKWVEQIKNIHKGWPAKGAVLVTIDKVIPTPA